MKIDPANQVPAALVSREGDMVALAALPPFQTLPGVVVWGDRTFVLHGSEKANEYLYEVREDGSYRIDGLPKYVETMIWVASPLNVEPIPPPERVER